MMPTFLSKTFLFLQGGMIQMRASTRCQLDGMISARESKQDICSWHIKSLKCRGFFSKSSQPLIPPKHFISLHLLFSIHYWHLSVLKYIYLTWFVFHCTYSHQMSVMKTFLYIAIFVIIFFFCTMLALCTKL